MSSTTSSDSLSAKAGCRMVTNAGSESSVDAECGKIPAYRWRKGGDHVICEDCYRAEEEAVQADYEPILKREG